MPTIERHRTALVRPALSRPVRLALEEGLLGPGLSLFDYGCGRGDDLRLLRESGLTCDGWDPSHRPEAARRDADVVNIGYVVNVIEDAAERAEALRSAWSLVRRVLVVAARTTAELRELSEPEELADGVLTKRSTFQKFYEQSELKAWIDATLGEASVAAAPGIFYVFRDLEAREMFLASRYRRRVSAPRLRQADQLFGAHREALQSLIAFVGELGRLPEPDELPNASALTEVFGNLRRAFAVVRRATGDDHWETVRAERAEDLKLYLALARFDRRPRASELPRSLQLDGKRCEVTAVMAS